jgi:hypothetical protein
LYCRIIESLLHHSSYWSTTLLLNVSFIRQLPSKVKIEVTVPITYCGLPSAQSSSIARIKKRGLFICLTYSNQNSQVPSVTSGVLHSLILGQGQPGKECSKGDPPCFHITLSTHIARLDPPTTNCQRIFLTTKDANKTVGQGIALKEISIIINSY